MKQENISILKEELQIIQSEFKVAEESLTELKKQETNEINK